MRNFWQTLFLACATAVAMSGCSGTGAVPDATQRPSLSREAQVTALEYGRPSQNATVGNTAVHAHLPKGAKSSGGGNLVYHGGPIQKHPVVYVIYWGFDGPAQDPNGVAPYLTSFLQGLSGNSYFNIVTQYSSTAAGNITDPAGEFAGAWTDTSSIPNQPSDEQLAKEAIRAAAHFGYNYDASYVIQLPHGSYNPSLKWCAYHNVTSSQYGDVHYTNLPYQPDFPVCGANSVNPGARGLLDSTSETAAHEIAETQTDPDTKTGWFDNYGNEIGDYCSYIKLQNITISTGTFATQPLWSNAANYCAISYP